jgi:signal transduction histidine kinase
LSLRVRDPDSRPHPGAAACPFSIQNAGLDVSGGYHQPESDPPPVLDPPRIAEFAAQRRDVEVQGLATAEEIRLPPRLQDPAPVHDRPGVGASIDLTDGSAAPDLSRVLVDHTPVFSAIGGGRMTVSVPIHPGRPAQGALQVSVSSAPLTTRIHQFHLLLGGVSVAVLIGGALIALALARWIGRPVRDLERVTRSLADGATTAASTTTGPPELRRLAATFNTTAVRLQELIAAQRSFALTARGPDEVTAQVIPGALEQILDNLIANALDVAPAGTTVTVCWQSDGTTVELHVIDAGPGLTEHDRAQALQPFWRAPDARKGGTGLGLALVRKLAEASGGRTRLDPAVPTGIDAVVALPA